MVIDESTFVEIYDRFAPKIYKFCYFRVNSREEAEDIAAQTFIRAWDHIREGNEVDNIQAFLYRIANNLVIDFYRKRKGRYDVSLDDPQHPIDIPDTSPVPESIDRDLLVEEIEGVLKQLPEPYRDVVLLKYTSDLSTKEIAHVLGTSENNISVRLHRAIDKIKELYEKR